MSTATATMTTQQVADRLVNLCREGNFEGAVNELYHTDIESNEPVGAGPGPQRVKGIDAVRAKTVEWGKGVEEMHSASISDPVVAGNHFAVAMKVDVTMNGAGRINMDEVAVYEVTDGKITRDQFFYPAMPGQN
jgi:hypothetical protein